MPLSTSYHWQRSKIINISLTEWCGIKMVGPIRHLAWSKKNFIKGIFWLKDLAFAADPLGCLQFFRPCRCSSTLSNLVSGSSEPQKEWGPLHEWSGSNDVTYGVKVSIGIFLPVYKKKFRSHWFNHGSWPRNKTGNIWVWWMVDMSNSWLNICSPASAKTGPVLSIGPEGTNRCEYGPMGCYNIFALFYHSSFKIRLDGAPVDCALRQPWACLSIGPWRHPLLWVRGTIIYFIIQCF